MLNRPAAWYQVVRILAVLVLATLPLTCNVFTSAKYISAATGTAAARVAEWNVDVDDSKWPARKKTISPIPLNAITTGHPLVLFFEGVTSGGALIKKNASFPLELINDSEVSARYKVKTLVAAPAGDGPGGKGNIDDYILFYDLDGDYASIYDDALDPAVTGTTINAAGVITIAGAGVGGAALVIEPADNGIILAPGEGSRTVDVVIKPCTFTDLEFWLYIEQVN